MVENQHNGPWVNLVYEQPVDGLQMIYWCLWLILTMAWLIIVCAKGHCMCVWLRCLWLVATSSKKVSKAALLWFRILLKGTLDVGMDGAAHGQSERRGCGWGLSSCLIDIANLHFSTSALSRCSLRLGGKARFESSWVQSSRGELLLNFSLIWLEPWLKFSSQVQTLWRIKFSFYLVIGIL